MMEKEIKNALGKYVWLRFSNNKSLFCKVIEIENYVLLVKTNRYSKFSIDEIESFEIVPKAEVPDVKRRLFNRRIGSCKNAKNRNLCTSK